jgi:parvulin-like peptidyl-prolyl isomerase
MINNRILKIIKDPLLHFLVLGAGLFLLYSVIDKSGETATQRIVVDQNQALRLAEQFRRTWMRPPTHQELENMAQEFVKEEILYREALALGLDRDDLVIRRRLRQKMEFISSDLVEPKAPLETELQTYFDANREKFRSPDRYSLQQVYLDPSKTSSDVLRTAEDLIRRLNSNPALAPDPTSIGDFTILPYQVDALTGHEVANIYGKAFATYIADAPGGRWSGPYESSFGVHLIRILNREPGQIPSMAEIRRVIEQEWTAKQRNAANDAYYQMLRSRYDVEIRLPDPANKTLAMR